MPKRADYCIEWSEKDQAYQLTHGALCHIFYGSLDDLHFWFDRLETFHFCSSTGHSMTLRKEKKQRGTGYWYAYKRVGGKVHKKYLGTDISKLDFQVLATLARSFVGPAETESPPKEPPRQPTFKFLKTLDSALEIFGFPAIPNKKAFITRYRELSHKHHPDHNGLHEDMVAVNLSYDYLKSFVR